MSLDPRPMTVAFALMAFAIGSAVAQTALPKASPAERATLQKFVQAYMNGLEDNDYHEVVAEEVALRIKEGKKDFVVVDVRMPKDKKYDLGHVPGAIHIDLNELVKPASLAKLPRNKEIILYCDTGQQQNKAVVALRLLGYEAYVMKWGYMAWAASSGTETTLQAIKEASTVGYPVQK